VPATAHYKARDFSAHVIFLGYQKDGGLGYPQLSVIIDGLENAVSASELSLFQGPDLSKIVLERNTMEVSIVRNRATWSIKTRSVFTGIPFFPSQIMGHETQMFETNIGSTKSEVYAWRKFVAEMSSGFDEAHITIGGQVLSEKITVAFSGKGIEPLLKQMMTFTGLK
jgi:hypothetical protein